MTVVRDDLVDKIDEQNKEEKKVIVRAEYIEALTNTVSTDRRLVTPYPAKNIDEVFSIFKKGIEDYENRTNVKEEARIRMTGDHPDIPLQVPTISTFIEKRIPGAFSEGEPSESLSSRVRQYRPVLREEVSDPENPGYITSILGMWYDNWVSLTPWGNTMKEASSRALWLENIMEEYLWFFTATGINRIIYQGREKTQRLENNNNYIYGCPLIYYVRTEKLTHVSEKVFERLVVNFDLHSS